MLGCISPEERSIATLQAMQSIGKVRAAMMVIEDPSDGFPDYSAQTSLKIDAQRVLLQRCGLGYEEIQAHLLANYDALHSSITPFEDEDTVLLDITSLPKRYFCFFLKRLLASEGCRNLVVTYAEAAHYTSDHLSEDPMTCAALPGFQGPTDTTSQLAVSIGFESLNLDSFLDLYKQETKYVHFLLPFPPNGEFTRRTWCTLRQVVRNNDMRVQGRLSIIPAWDAELVYLCLSDIYTEGELALAPYGPKPHTLGMTLFAVKNDVGIYYSQPKSYNPEYSRGVSEIRAYVVKWDGVACYDRPRLPL